MTEHLLLGIASIIVLGIAAQWLAWRLHLPSILLLLLVGFVAGPVTHFLNPDELLGGLLFPGVSMAVALILFEGGLSLKLQELRITGHIVRNLVTVGALVTWFLSATLAYFILELDMALALLFGAVLVVTGPTVIIPLLRHIHAVGRVSSIVKWEGIVNDPIGAVLAVLVFEGILATGFQQTTMTIVISLLETLLIGIILGGITAWILIFLLQRYWIPDYLQNAVALMMVIGAFTASNLIQQESGLFTVTLMGIILANQKAVNIKHIIEFKENLGVVLLSGLFIILAARLELEALAHIGPSSLLFLVLLVLIVRPASVLVATIKSGLNWREKLFLSWMAPRGIVAAAVISVFSLELAESTVHVNAELMVPEMFLIIVGTVAVYGLSAVPMGRWLGVADPNPQGMVIVGGQEWARTIGRVIQNEGYKVIIVDTNPRHLNAARMEGLPTCYASVLSEYVLDEIDLGGVGRLLALTPNDEVNSLATLHFTEVFSRAEVYQLPVKKPEGGRKETVSSPLRGRLLFDAEATYYYLDNHFKAGFMLKKTKLTEKFDYAGFREFYGDEALPLFLIDETGELIIYTVDYQPVPQVGQSLISLVPPEPQEDATTAETVMELA